MLMGGFDVARLAMAFDGLGFNVESTTAPFEILVIDHVQRPSPAYTGRLLLIEPLRYERNTTSIWR